MGWPRHSTICIEEAQRGTRVEKEENEEKKSAQQ
jgi:hypothetical protein